MRLRRMLTDSSQAEILGTERIIAKSWKVRHVGDG